MQNTEFNKKDAPDIRHMEQYERSGYMCGAQVLNASQLGPLRLIFLLKKMVTSSTSNSIIHKGHKRNERIELYKGKSNF